MQTKDTLIIGWLLIIVCVIGLIVTFYLIGVNSVDKYKFKRDSKKEKERKQQTLKDIQRGKAVLEMIDNHLINSGQTRKQRKNFWAEFFKSQNVRSHVYSIIEKSLEGDTKYKEKK